MTLTPYYIKIAPAAQMQISLLAGKEQRLVVKIAEALAINPRPPGAKKIDGMMGLYAEEMEQLRIVYKIEEQEVLLLFVK